MKPIFSEKVTTHVGLEDTWYYFIQFDHAKKWMPGVSEMRVPLDSLPLKIGSRIEATVNGNLQRSEVVAYEPEQKITLRSVIGHFQADYAYVFRAVDEGTEISLDATCEAHGFVTRFISIFIRKMIRKSDEGQLKSFKVALESDKSSDS